MAWKETLSSMLRYLLMVLCFVLYFWIGLNFFIFLQGNPAKKVPVNHGFVMTVLSYLTGACILMSLPTAFLNVVGLVLLNPFTEPSKPTIGDSTPFVCFRVVTRGMYPQLVKNTTLQNLEVCRRNGLKNFKFEIVTDKAVSLEKYSDILETVVPEQYRTPNNALYKARALHYCLEPNINILSNEDWIVHLDEETKLTDDVIYGICNFVNTSKADIGQGVIVYADDVIENWITTLMDGIRVAFDYGLMRLALQVLKRPIFGFKGSFIVTRVKAEIDIGFDFGPTESIAEDLRFALTAWDKSYKFGFVHGVMVEKSTFTFMDFIKQRKRWFTGHFHVLWGNTVPLYCKIMLLPLNIANLFMWVQIVNTIVSFFHPLIPLDDFLYVISFLIPSVLFCYVFGNFMSFRRRRFGVLRTFFIVICSQLLMPLTGILESIASVWGFFTRNSITFHIVEKQTFKPQGEREAV